MKIDDSGTVENPQSEHDAERIELFELQRTQRSLIDELERLAVLRREQQPRPETKDVAHAIALGSVLARLGLRAADSWKVDGFLSGSVGDAVERLNAAALLLSGKNFGAVLVRAIDLDGDAMHAKGQAAAWRRKYRTYLAEREEWLATDRVHRTEGSWRQKGASPGQVELVRVTCAILEIDLPALISRGAMHDWLDANGANLRYPRNRA